MNRFNSVFVVPIRSLEVGDRIAMEFLGDVISGKITGIAHFAMDLTTEQTAYMVEQNLSIPENKYETLGGRSSCLIFGEFVSSGTTHNHPNHMFVDYDINVAVFPTREGN